jgi:hypothetical protein
MLQNIQVLTHNCRQKFYDVHCISD